MKDPNNSGLKKQPTQKSHPISTKEIARLFNSHIQTKLNSSFGNTSTIGTNEGGSFERTLMISYNQNNSIMHNNHVLGVSPAKKGVLSIITVNAIAVFIAFLGAMLLSNIASAQISRPAATVNQKGVVQLPTDKPLSNQYEIDLSKYNFKSDSEMIEFFSTRSGEHYLVRALTEQKKALLVLQTEATPNWDVVKWNEHLNTQTTRTPFKK